MKLILWLLFGTVLTSICYSLTVTKRLTQCGSTAILTADNGTITSHAGYDAGHHYGKDLNCTWVIQAPAGQVVEVVAESFNTEKGLFTCYDYLQLYDGNTVRSKSLGQFCGHTFNPITSTQQFLTLQFVTDSGNQRSGFRLHYYFTQHVIHTCPHGRFVCANGICIPHSRRCDGDDDCTDDSDEQNCPAVTCSPQQFQCANKNCITDTWYCDGYSDCADGSDEVANCTAQPSHGFIVA